MNNTFEHWQDPLLYVCIVFFLIAYIQIQTHSHISEQEFGPEKKYNIYIYTQERKKRKKVLAKKKCMEKAQQTEPRANQVLWPVAFPITLRLGSLPVSKGSRWLLCLVNLINPINNDLTLDFNTSVVLFIFKYLIFKLIFHFHLDK